MHDWSIQGSDVLTFSYRKQEKGIGREGAGWGKGVEVEGVGGGGGGMGRGEGERGAGSMTDRQTDGLTD